MKKYLLLVVLFFCIAVTYAFDKGKWTGYISDSDCGVKGNKKDHAACAKKCIAAGAKPVFVVGEKVYTINNPEKVANFIGQKVTISGTITDDALEIDKVGK
ncbi:hypothetical protein BH11BAC5_BH11BAC5_49290 [soil metagenome]|jgi:hypothetical protein